MSAYLQALANEGVATALVVSPPAAGGVSGLRAVSGETPPMFTTSAIACVTLDADGKVSSSGRKALQPQDGQRHLTAPGARRYGSSGGCHPRPQSISAVRRHRRTLWCLVKRHNMRMLRQPQRGLLFEDVFPVPVHHAGAKHMLAAAGGN